MFYAIDPEQRRIEATPKAKGLCPTCMSDVRAKCGKVVTWHWAHVEKECDPFSEPMTAWHKEWQAEFPEVCREFVVPLNGEVHRADVLAPTGVVIEFQHSSISVDDIRARETFYPRMLWVFDARDAHATSYGYNQQEGYYETRRFGFNTKHEKQHGWSRYGWTRPRKCLAHCQRPVLLDLDSELLYLLHPVTSAAFATGRPSARGRTDPPSWGTGSAIPRREFVNALSGLSTTSRTASVLVNAASSADWRYQ